MLLTKCCSRCKEDKSLSDYYKDRTQKDGYDNICKVCKKEVREERYASRKPITDTKHCHKCDCVKPVTEFGRCKKNPDGLSKSCKSCIKKPFINCVKTEDDYKYCHQCNSLLQINNFYDNKLGYKGKTNRCKKCELSNIAETYKNNPEKFIERAKTFRRNNTEKVKITAKKYIANNRSKVRAKNATRRVAERKAIPSWTANDELHRFIIEEIYDLADIRSKLYNKLYHVDHIVPLRASFKRGKKNINVACGLHVWWNLHPMLGSENDSKNCFSWPDQWDYSSKQEKEALKEMLENITG